MEEYRKTNIIGYSSLISIIIAWATLDSLGIFMSLYSVEYGGMNLAQWLGLFFLCIGVGLILTNISLHNLRPSDALSQISGLMQQIGGMSKEEADKTLSQFGENTKTQIKRKFIHYTDVSRIAFPAPSELLGAMQRYYRKEFSKYIRKVGVVGATTGMLSVHELSVIPGSPAKSDGLQDIGSYRKSTLKKLLIGAIFVGILLLIAHYLT